MSFILDALRKADAERARGALPDLHTQPVLHASSASAPRPPWLAVAAGVVLLVGAAAAATGWLVTRRDADRPITVAAVAVSAAASAPASAPASAAVVPVASAAVAAPLPAPVKNPPVIRAAPPPAPPAAPPAAPRIYAVSELPEPVRRELPALAVGGAMHSDNPASRMLILNGQLFHEHDRLAPNLTLVQIQLKSALLDFRGYRYRITY